MTTINEDNAVKITHNNIPCTKTKIINLIKTINERDDLSSAEKSYNEELLTYCIASTNGRTIEQKIQDLTEIIAHVACHSIKSSLDNKDLSIRMTQLERLLTKRIDSLELSVNHINSSFIDAVHQIMLKFDKLESNLDEKIDKIQDKIQQNNEHVLEHIANLKAYDNLQDKTVDLKLKYIDDSIPEQDQSNPTIIKSIENISNNRPWLTAFIVGIFVFAIMYSQRFVDFLKSLFH